MKTIIAKYNIECIWHFTDRSNLESIEEYGGLLSLGELERRGIEIPVPGGNQWSHEADKIKGLHEYVHMVFVDDHPMLYRATKEGRIKDPVWLKINSSILQEDRVRFCADVSNKKGVDILDAERAKEEIDFEVLFTHMDWRDPEINRRRQAAIKSEILMPDIVPIEKILGFKNG
jgi:hypothetical protein